MTLGLDDLCIVVRTGDLIRVPQVVDAWECYVVSEIFEQETGTLYWVVGLMGEGIVSERKRRDLRRVVSTFVGLVVVDQEMVE